MLDEFIRYSALQRDQLPLASLLVYLKRKGGFVQLNQIWRELGPTGEAPSGTRPLLSINSISWSAWRSFPWNAGSFHRSAPRAKKKTNTFYRLSPATAALPYIFGMLKIYKESQTSTHPSLWISLSIICAIWQENPALATN